MFTRRNFLAASGMLAVATTVGCRRGLVRPPECDHFNTDDGRQVVDAHCHIFNASDLQVSGFVNQVKLADPIWAVLQPLGHVLQEVAWTLAPTVPEELAWLRRDVARRGERVRATGAAAPMSASVEAFEADTVQRLAGFFQAAERRDPDAVEDFRQSLTRLYGVQQMTGAGLAPRSLANARTVEQLLVIERSAVRGGLAPMTFLATFFRYRTQNAWQMLSMYGCHSAPGLDMLCPAIVDFDLWIGEPSDDDGQTPSRIIDQVHLMGEIARATEGRVYAYAAFNPLRAACDDDYESALFAAVEAGQCAGFKLYPPMGFAATGNAQHGLNTLPACRKPGMTPVNVSRERLDEVLGAFFARCSESDIPVLAHASPSNGSVEGAAVLAGPRYWRDLMGGYATTFLRGDSKLRISLGHMGGGGGRKLNEEWRAAIVQLMEDYPNQIFADLSYHESFLTADLDEARTQYAFLANRGNIAAQSQTLYGTDWSMLAMQSRAPQYLNSFWRVLADIGVDDEVRWKVIGLNAALFLGLNEGQAPGIRRAAWLAG